MKWTSKRERDKLKDAYKKWHKPKKKVIYVKPKKKYESYKEYLLSPEWKVPRFAFVYPGREPSGRLLTSRVTVCD